MASTTTCSVLHQNQILLIVLITRHPLILLSSRFQVYGKVGSSFRSDGFNVGSAPVPGTAATGGNGFFPESTTAFELGGKVEGHLGNAPARVTIAIFDQDVKNVQRAVYFTPPGGVLAGFTVNVPRSRVRGLDFEGYINPVT